MFLCPLSLEALSFFLFSFVSMSSLASLLATSLPPPFFLSPAGDDQHDISRWPWHAVGEPQGSLPQAGRHPGHSGPLPHHPRRPQVGHRVLGVECPARLTVVSVKSEDSRECEPDCSRGVSFKVLESLDCIIPHIIFKIYFRLKTLCKGVTCSLRHKYQLPLFMVQNQGKGVPPCLNEQTLEISKHGT